MFFGLFNKKSLVIATSFAMVVISLGVFGVLAWVWGESPTARTQIHPTIFHEGVRVHDGMRIPPNAVLDLQYQFSVPYGFAGELEVFLPENIVPVARGFVDIDARDSMGRRLNEAVLHIGPDGSVVFAISPRVIHEGGFSLPVTLPAELSPEDEEDCYYEEEAPEYEDYECEGADITEEEADNPSDSVCEEDDLESPPDDAEEDDSGSGDDNSEDEDDEPAEDTPQNEDDTAAEDAPESEDDTAAEDTPESEEDESSDDENIYSEDDDSIDDLESDEDSSCDAMPPCDEGYADSALHSVRMPFRLGITAQASGFDDFSAANYYMVSFTLQAVPDFPTDEIPAYIRLTSGGVIMRVELGFEEIAGFSTAHWDPGFERAVRLAWGMTIGVITSERIYDTDGLDLWNRGLTSVAGIEDFVNLRWLELPANQLTSIDLSQNTQLLFLNLTWNQLTSLDLSHNTALTDLHASHNRLISLNLSHNTALIDLHLDHNRLTHLDISRNPALEVVSARGNQLSSFSVSDNRSLMNLWITDNYIATPHHVMGWQSRFPYPGTLSSSRFWFFPQRGGHLGGGAAPAEDYPATYTPDVSHQPTPTPLPPRPAEVVTGSPPPGIYLTPDGELRGTPTQRGRHRFTVRLPDGSREVFILNVLDNTDENIARITTPGYEFVVRIPDEVPHATDITFMSQGPHEHFVDLWLNGRLLLRGLHYDHAPGSTVLTLRAQAFDDHAVQGRNTIVAEFRQADDLRIAAQNFYLLEGNPPPTPPPSAFAVIPPNANVLEYAIVYVPMSATLYDTNIPSAWALNDVQTAIESGLVPANLRGRYRSYMTRANFAHLADALYSRSTGIAVTGRLNFSDTQDVRIQRMAYLGVMDCMGDGTFNPQGVVTREEAAVMLERLAFLKGRPLPPAAPMFADNAQISHMAFESVGRVQAAGIMGGAPGGVFDPAGVMSREQGIVVMLRLFGL